MADVKNFERANYRLATKFFLMKKIKIMFLTVITLIIIFGTTSCVFAKEYITENDMKNILKKLEKENITNDDILAYTYQFNNFLTNYNETNNDIASMLNISFFVEYNSHNIIFTISNGTFSNILDFIYIDFDQYSSTSLLYGFESWNKDNNNNIIGFNNNNYNYYTLKTNGVSTGTKNSYSYLESIPISIQPEQVTLSKCATFVKTFLICGHTKKYGYNSYFLNNYVEIESLKPKPEPEPDPKPSGDTGGTKIDLTKIENGIGKINQNIGKTNEKIDEIKEKIPTSGDISGIIENTFSGDVPPIDENKVNDKFNNIQKEIDNKLGLFDYSNFLFSIANGLATSLLGTGNIEIELKLPSGQIQKINSKDITNKNTELKQFLSVFTNTAIIITLVISIQWIINKIKEGDIIYMLDLGDAEMYFYKDMNMM